MPRQYFIWNAKKVSKLGEVWVGRRSNQHAVSEFRKKHPNANASTVERYGSRIFGNAQAPEEIPRVVQRWAKKRRAYEQSLKDRGKDTKEKRIGIFDAEVLKNRRADGANAKKVAVQKARERLMAEFGGRMPTLAELAERRTRMMKKSDRLKYRRHKRTNRAFHLLVRFIKSRGRKQRLLSQRAREFLEHKARSDLSGNEYEAFCKFLGLHGPRMNVEEIAVTHHLSYADATTIIKSAVRKVSRGTDIIEAIKILNQKKRVNPHANRQLETAMQRTG